MENQFYMDLLFDSLWLWLGIWLGALFLTFLNLILLGIMQENRAKGLKSPIAHKVYISTYIVIFILLGSVFISGKLRDREEDKISTNHDLLTAEIIQEQQKYRGRTALLIQQISEYYSFDWQYKWQNKWDEDHLLRKELLFLGYTIAQPYLSPIRDEYFAREINNYSGNFWQAPELLKEMEGDIYDIFMLSGSRDHIAYREKRLLSFLQVLSEDTTVSPDRLILYIEPGAVEERREAWSKHRTEFGNAMIEAVYDLRYLKASAREETISLPNSFIIQKGRGLCHYVSYQAAIRIAEYYNLLIWTGKQYLESNIITPEQAKELEDQTDYIQVTVRVFPGDRLEITDQLFWKPIAEGNEFVSTNILYFSKYNR